MKKIEFTGLVQIFETEEIITTSIRALDDEGKKFTKQSIGVRRSNNRKIRFNDIIQEFKNGDIVKVTFEKEKNQRNENDE